MFPNEASLLRLITALLSEVSTEWETQKNLPQHGIQNLALSSMLNKFTEKKLRGQTDRLALEFLLILGLLPKHNKKLGARVISDMLKGLTSRSRPTR